MEQLQKSEEKLPEKKKYEPKYDITDPNFAPEYDFNGDFFSLNVFQKDPLLRIFQKHFEIRNSKYEELFDRICEYEKGIINFSHSYNDYGLIPTEEGILYREWLPGAKEVYLIGDFNNWNRTQYPAVRKEFGKWELFIPKNEKGEQVIPHNTRVKIHLLQANDAKVDRIPAWIRYAVQNEEDKTFSGCMWNPSERFEFKHESPALKKQSLKIYECHIGMAGIEPRVHSYKEFMNNVLPRIKKAGYNCIQIMAIMEHPYYGSFGYHVSSFFAVSSRFGTPDDFKLLVDTAHSMGIIVLIDLIHSHATKNCQDGLNQLDGTDHLYFHEGGAGVHSQWDSRIFNYSNWEVIRFLLSNLAWYLEEYNIDGFRFDGITSMMYKHHGIGQGFSGDYHEYFSEWTDIDAVAYLMLANTLIKRIKPTAITIAEDVSGMPTLGSPVSQGGIGFDYRLAMAIPDKWIQLLKTSDEFWNMENIFFTLWNRRYDENVIAYTESHDQAIVGDKTISMHLFDAEIYWNMALEKQETIIVNRGLALHKIIRIITLALGGDAYLNFMGNEFGHPEWIDFPREGNGWTYDKCIRRWDLADNEELRYKYLLRFDEEMLKLEAKYEWLSEKKNHKTLTHDLDKIIIFERAGLIFVFNFHPTQSYTDYIVGTSYPFPHKIIFDSDDSYFGGQNRMKAGHTTPFLHLNEPTFNKPYSIKVYIPSRTMLILRPVVLEKELDLISKEDQENCEFKISQAIIRTVMEKEEKEQKLKKEVEDEMNEKIKIMNEKLLEEKRGKLEQVNFVISNEYKNEFEKQIKEIKQEYSKKQ